VTLRARPRAPWHSGTTRRLAVLRVGLPTFLACVFAAGPAMATKAPKMPSRAAAIVSNAATLARQTLDPPPGGDRADADGGRRRDADGERPADGR
jgi:hypothetical protein